MSTNRLIHSLVLAAALSPAVTARSLAAASECEGCDGGHRAGLRQLVAAALVRTVGGASAEALPAPEPAPAPAEQLNGVAKHNETPAEAVAVTPEVEDELSIDPAEPDFTVVNLPTTARLPRYKTAFRVTHRFARPLGQGDFGDLVQDFLGFDSGAQIGIDVRFAPVRGGQIGFYRTSDRTIQFSGSYNVVQQKGPSPLGLSIVAGVEGADNFKEHRVPTFGFVVSRKFGSRLALYASPLWLREPGGNDGHVEHAHEAENVFIGGYGGRLRLTSSAYLVGEWVPRLDSKAVLKNHITVGLEKGVGGHAFQLNVSNAVGTTFAQISRGANNYDDWFIGFNLSRKFY